MFDESMTRRKASNSPDDVMMEVRKEEQDSKTDGLVQKTADELFRKMQKGENVSLPVLLEGIVNAVMERERDYFLQSTEDYSNGFYTRKLQLAMGKLNLKVPRVRHSKGWRPALLPARWGRVYGDYGQILTALMVNGYSQRQMMDSLRELNLPYSQEKIDDICAVVNERLEDYRRMPLPSELFAVFMDAYHARLRDGEKMKEVGIFTAIGIDFDGHKSILGYWVKEGGRQFDSIADAVATENGELAERLRGRRENYTAFLKYPRDVRKNIYTTNSVESVNAGLECMRYDLGGYFPSRRSLDINYYIQIEHRNDGWLRRAVATVSSNTYELRQMFELRFGIGKGSDQ